MPAVIRFAGDGFKPFSLALERFGDNLQDADQAFDRMADFAATIFAAQFESTGTRMGGSKWAPLSPKYAHQKARKFPGQPLMVATGSLRNSLAFRPFGIEQITSSKMIIGTGIEHAKYHQNGAGNLPQRKLIGRLNAQDMKGMSKILHDHIVKGVSA